MVDDEKAVRVLVADVGVDEVTVVTGLSTRPDVNSAIDMYLDELSRRPHDADLDKPDWPFREGTYKDELCPGDARKS